MTQKRENLFEMKEFFIYYEPKSIDEFHMKSEEIMMQKMKKTKSE